MDTNNQQELDEMRDSLRTNTAYCTGAIGVVGGSIDLFNTEDMSNPVRIEEVIRALPMINRYCGQTLHPFSVAQHSLNLTYAAARFAGVSRAEQLQYILFHDAAEAFIGDIIRPIKRLMPTKLALLEACIMSALLVTIIPDPVHRLQVMDPEFQVFVHELDTDMAATETVYIQNNDLLPTREKIPMPESAFAYTDYRAVMMQFSDGIDALKMAAQQAPHMAHDDFIAFYENRCS